MTRSAFVRTAATMSAGALVWAVHFVVIYGYTGLACARRFESAGATLVALVPWVIALGTLLASAAAAILIRPVLKADQPVDFTRWMGAGVAALGLAAMLMEAVSIVWLPVCG